MSRDSTPLLHGLAALEGERSTVLILGSMPGAASLAAGQYYAHPRNAFWSIMGALFGAGPDLPYALRTTHLTSSGVAVWDVLASCRRNGSLDSAIAPQARVANDFAALFHRHPEIGHIFFNGSTAETLFQRHVHTRPQRADCACTRLPSTSPAHAAYSLDDKLAAWTVVAVAAALDH